MPRYQIHPEVILVVHRVVVAKGAVVREGTFLNDRVDEGHSHQGFESSTTDRAASPSGHAVCRHILYLCQFLD